MLKTAALALVLLGQQPALPDSAKPADALKPFEFMVGTWVGVNPNKTVNEEIWTKPRGSVMIGTFRQVRRDGKCAFVEVSQLSAEKEGIRLRLRHLHGGLEVPDSRKEHSDFLLRKVEKNRAEFYGTGNAEAVTSVVYQLVEKNKLTVQYTYAPGSKEQGFTSTYYRER